MARPRKITPDCIRIARELSARRIPKGTIKRTLAEQFGLSARSIETVFARAREEALAEFGKPKAEHQSDSLEFYQTVIRDPKASNKDKIRAQEGIDRLLGLSAQFKSTVELSGPDGQPIQVAETSAVLFLPTLEEDPEPPQNGNGNGNGKHHLETSDKGDQAAVRTAVDFPA